MATITRLLRPEKFEADPGTPAADLKYLHWKETFENYLAVEIEDVKVSDSTKLKILLNNVSSNIYSFLRNIKDYTKAIRTLDEIYLKPKNEIHARFILTSTKQKPEETVGDFLRNLQQLSFNCNFKSVTAEEYRNDYVRDAFIAGIHSQKIRQRLLENLEISLEEAYNQATSLEMAEKNSNDFKINTSNSAMDLNQVENINLRSNSPNLAATSSRKRCFFCGGNVHQRIKCPAFRATCQICEKKGHFAKVCRSSYVSNKLVNNAIADSNDERLSAILAASPASLRKCTVPITINDCKADALIDSGSSTSFINKNFAELLRLKRHPWKETVTLASKKNCSHVDGYCTATIKLCEHTYKQKSLYILEDLCADVIIGHDILQDHSSVEIEFGGPAKALKICNVMAAAVPPVSLFSNLSSNIKPVAIKSRKYSEADNQFIKDEIGKLLKDHVIEPSNSPWRAQVLVTGGTTHRKRLVIDYSLTINRYTELDAYPLPNIESIVSEVAKHNFFSQIDLKSAYHQIPILPSEKKYTAFEACGNLYQFTRIPFGVTNGVAAFQRTLQYVISKEKLTGTFAYLDDVTICGKTKEEHDHNLKQFKKVAEKYNLSLNEEKCIYGQESVKLLGYEIINNSIRPDEERLRPLINLPIPNDSQSLKRALGMFAHYSKWIKNFSEKINPLTAITEFPLNETAINCFQKLKSDIAKSALTVIDPHETFTVETDASEHSIAASLSQNGRPVAFFSRSLNDSERRHSSIEKEATAVVEALRKWRHYLIGRHFRLITDQRSVSFMFNQSHSSKIKNEKIERWRLELSNYKYDIIYRPGKENVTADTLSRICASSTIRSLNELHTLLGHPGIVRMTHWVRSKNLPYSVDDIKRITSGCRICAEVKPRFVKKQGTLIKATAPFERLNIDFKGPLPSTTSTRYILTIIDEYSRFPFAYPCKDLSAATVMKCLKDLFLTFGSPQYIHSDRGSAFMSEELRSYLVLNGIACSRTTPYNPQGNGQVERLNGTLWKTIKLHLKTKNLDVDHWQDVLPAALHSIRSLLCTTINATPHERFFKHPRRTIDGESLPTWLLEPGPVLMRNNHRQSKYDPEVEEVELIEANPSYSHVRLSDGREATISNRQLAPLPTPENDPFESRDHSEPAGGNEVVRTDEATSLRRSSRERRPPVWLRDYET
ncbi:uncharacterized protein LOC106717015 [Papilio machaon]|uniref:uncharacterized protein LOC106717015 n=1 Tax=Papilio machaon TaxID=76193 RepID=UPI001E6654A4|nr:uncharacterized protein LOC106717015 [Papilio machaon]